jgi:hypothetical protein
MRVVGLSMVKVCGVYSSSKTPVSRSPQHI